MKFLLLATFVIACTATTVYRNKNISVNDDGTILITSPSGKRVAITRELGLNGQKNIEIAISGPNIPTKRIEVTDDNLEQRIGENQWSSVDNLNEEYRLKRGSVKGKSQGDILSEILREYQGVVDDVQYEKLLNKINKAVKKGEVSPQIYDLLEGLDQQQQQQQYGSGFLGQYVQGQQQYGNGVVGQYVQGQQYPQEQYIQGQQYPQGLYGRYGVYGQGQVLGTQYPYYYGRQIWASTPNVNPLMARILPVGQNYFGDLLATQQLYGGVQGRQIFPQGTWTRDVLSGNSLLGRLVGNQQLSYGQRQVYGLQQTIPKVYQQQVENVLEQLNDVQVQQIIQTVEQLYEIQQQQGQLSIQQLQQLQQVVDVIEQLNQQQLSFTQQQQIQQAIEQLNEIQQQQVGGRQRGQLFGQQIVQRNIPLTLQQLIGVSQTRGAGLAYRQPIFNRGFRTVQQPMTVQGRTGSYLNTIPQMDVVY